MADWTIDQWLPVSLTLILMAYLVGRWSAKGGMSGEDRDEARMRAEAAAENAFSGLSPSTQDEIDGLLRAGKTLEAIKRIREETGADLKAARDAALWRRRRLAG